MSKRMIDSELIEALGTDIKFDGTGNVIVGKNLEVNGKTKLNGGLEPVFTDNFELQDNEGTYSCTFIDYGEFKNSGFHLLYFSFDDDTWQTIGFGNYQVDNNGVTNLVIFGASSVDGEFQIVVLPNTDVGTIPTYTSIVPNSLAELTPIHTYNEGISTTIKVYSEINNSGSYTFFGDVDGNLGIGYYKLGSSGEISMIQFLSLNNSGISVYAGQDNWVSYVTQYELIDEMNKKQNKLYRHVITLHANSTSDGSCRLEYISPKDLVCDSLQDLRTVLGNPQMNSYIASNPSGDLFGVVISPSTAQIKKVGTTSLLNITSVSDTVTPL